MASYKIYIIDDNVKFLDRAVNYLNACSKIGSIGWSLSFQESEEKIQEFNPDYILIDFSMPDVSGIDALKIIKNYPNPPKVILLSINEDTPYEEEAYKAGADGFIIKKNFVREVGKLLKET